MAGRLPVDRQPSSSDISRAPFPGLLNHNDLHREPWVLMLALLGGKPHTSKFHIMGQKLNQIYPNHLAMVQRYMVTDVGEYRMPMNRFYLKFILCRLIAALV